MIQERVCFVFFAVVHFLVAVNTNVIKTTEDASEVKEHTTEPVKRYTLQHKPPQQQTEYYATAPTVINFEEGNYFEGDIILRPDQINGLKQEPIDSAISTLWPKGVLAYDYSDEFSAAQRAVIEEALADLQQQTCVRFVHRTTEPTYILLRNTDRGCASQVGYPPKGHVMDLYLNSPGCLAAGTIQHEFLHALGFWHEHTRPDREKYITIYWDNIIPDRKYNFLIRAQFDPQEKLPYDYLSVMHYRALAFSKDHISATIVPKDSLAFFKIGQRKRYSSLDLAKLNILYNCGPGYYTGDYNNNSAEEEEEDRKEEIGSEDASVYKGNGEDSSEESSSDENLFV